jgi:hypothetical protein
MNRAFSNLVLILFFTLFSCQGPAALLVLDPYTAEWEPEVVPLGLRAGESQGFAVEALTLSTVTDWDKEFYQLEAKEPELVVLSGLYSGAFLERMLEYWPQARIVLYGGGRVSAQGKVGVVAVNRESTFTELANFSVRAHQILDQTVWEAPALLAYTRPSHRQKEKQILEEAWNAMRPESPLYQQEFFRLRDFVDLTRMIKDILSQPRRPWVYLFTSVMTKDALEQLPPETLLMGEGLKPFLSDSSRLLASVEIDYQKIFEAAFEIGRLEEPGYIEVSATLWTNDQFAESLEKMAKARQQAEEEAKASELTETRDEGEENEEADAEDANGLEINQEASREEPPVTGQRESTDGTDSE